MRNYNPLAEADIEPYCRNQFKEKGMKNKTVEFDAHKTVKKPTEVEFTTKKGTKVDFVADKPTKVPVHVKFKTKR